tara:strand:- start:37 stop:549 length:513 start_codon:yes stop_codon:yes gene_type:complete
MDKAMDIELRGFKHHKGLSRETEAFTALLFVDGKKIAEVLNDGNGGATNISHLGNQKTNTSTRDDVRTFEEWCDKQPRLDGLDMDAEFYIDLMAQRIIRTRELHRLCKKNVVVRIEGESDFFDDTHINTSIYKGEYTRKRAESIRKIHEGKNQPNLIEIYNERFDYTLVK